MLANVRRTLSWLDVGIDPYLEMLDTSATELAFGGASIGQLMAKPDRPALVNRIAPLREAAAHLRAQRMCNCRRSGERRRSRIV